MKIIWSNQAKISYEKTIDFILENWTPDIATDFENRTNRLLDNLKKHAKLCPLSKKKNLRKCVIHKNTSLIYIIYKSYIGLVTFVDNRSDSNY